MDGTAVFVLVLGTVGAVVLTELVAAALPILIVILMVPAESRADLADLLAAADGARRLRMWSALRLAVTAHRDRDHTG